MFGQDNQNDQNTQDQPVGTAPEPVADGMLSNDHADDTGVAASPTIVSPVAEPADDASATAGPVIQPSTDRGAGGVVSDDLLSIKQQALQQLSPLVGHLEQTPEEKFRTTMMMIQASDDQSLIQAAYDAAKAIPDEKTRAQALLDIVNEINYFTQHNSS